MTASLTPQVSRATGISPCVKCGSTERYANGDCKPCANARNVAWVKANPEKVKAIAVRKRLRNAEKHKTIPRKKRIYTEAMRLSSAAWYKKNSERVIEKTSAWHKQNKEKTDAYLKKYYEKNKKEVNEAARKWSIANPEKVKKSQSEYRLRNLEGDRIKTHKRRAAKVSVGGTLFKGLAGRLFKLQKGKCPCCSLPLGDNYHMDHIMPLALGGSNTDDNIQLLRQRCNSQKCAKHPVDFMQSRGLLL